MYFHVSLYTINQVQTVASKVKIRNDDAKGFN